MTEYGEYLKTMIRNGVTAAFYVAFWPLISHAKKFYHEGRYLTSYGKDRIKQRRRFEESTIVSSRAQISKVCSESTFQPLLQLYLFLPRLMYYDYPKLLSISVTNFAKEIPRLQLWSIIASCLALAWSFSSYKATKMNGALDFTSNFAGRLVLLFSCICQISARLVIFVIFAYTWGPGHFWPMVVGCCLHMLLMAYIHWATRNDARATDKLFWKDGQVFYQCLINGISNLYVHTSIVPREIGDEIRNSSTDEGGSDVYRCCNKELKMQRDLKQILVDVIICAENLAIVLGAYYSEIGIPTEFLVAVLAVHATGLLLMVCTFLLSEPHYCTRIHSHNEQCLHQTQNYHQVLFYQHLHIWSALIPTCPCLPSLTTLKKMMGLEKRPRQRGNSPV